MKVHKFLFAIGIALLFGCAGVSFQKFNPQGASIKSIALLTVSNPVQYQATDYGGKAGMFGAVGGAFVASKHKTASDAFTALVKSTNFRFGPEMQAAVAQRLKRAGFKVISVHVSRPAPNELLKDYAKVPSAGADALLDIDVRVVGYSNYNINDTDFRPYLLVDARLVSAKTKSVLYSEQIMFGYSNPYMSATQLPADKRYYFPEFEGLMGNQKKALGGMRSGMVVISRHIAKRLKGQ